MVRPTTQLRRARSVVVYWRKGRLVLQNFARRLTVCGAPITCEVLDFFSEWRTLSEAIDHFDYSEKSVRGALAQLEKHGLLLRKGSPEATEDSRLATEWSAWLPEGSFHFSTKDAVYIPSNRSFEDATAKVLQNSEGGEENTPASAYAPRLRVYPSPDGEKDPSTILQRRAHP